MSYNEVGGVFGDNEPEKVEITFSKVDDTFLDKFNKFLERAESRRERYDLTWNGKAAAFAEAGKPLEPAKTLRPDLGESVDFDKTQNLFITGDNLEALKLLQESYLNKVDMIYIDPPYNTGHDFIYHDDFHRSRSDEIDDSRDDEGNRQYSVNSKENGRYHSDWLSMMYPRLMIARNLLSDCGLIFISIDENEQSNLKLLCDEVFGEHNYVETFVWVKNSTKNLSKTTSTNHEYVLCYAKNITEVENKQVLRVEKPGLQEVQKILRDATDNGLAAEEAQNTLRRFYRLNPDLKGISMYDHVDYRIDPISGQKCCQAYRLSDVSAPKSTGKAADYPVIHPKTGLPCKSPATGWRFTRQTMERHVKNNLIYFYDDETHVPAFKRYLDTVTTEVMKSVVNDYTDGKKELMRLFDGEAYFDNAKPTTLIARFVGCFDADATILDFFAGSGTTADAVMQLNAEDGGHRKFIMVQLPEECSEKSEAYKAGYRTIDQLSRERIRRATKKIKESDKNFDDHDYGFRALYIDKANAKDDISIPADSLQQSQLSFQVDDIYADRSSLDLLFGVLVAKGWQLDGEIERRNINGNDVYLYDYVPDAGMVACFDNEPTDEAINQIIDMHPQVAVFRETAFKQSDEKINLMERFKNDSSETRVWVI